MIVYGLPAVGSQAMSYVEPTYAHEIKISAPTLIPHPLQFWGRGWAFLDPQGASAVRQWENAKKHARELGQLKPDWDGYGAAAIGEVTRNNTLHALDIIAALPIPMPVPEISPTSAGTISLNWEQGNLEAHLEIGNTRYSGYIEMGTQRPTLLEGQAEEMNAQVFLPIAATICSLTSNTTPTSFIAVQFDEVGDKLAA